MSQVLVTKEVLDSLAKELADTAKTLADCAAEIEPLFPDAKGFSLDQAPPMNDAMPALAEFAADVEAEIKAARHAQRFGPSSKARRTKRYRAKRENGEES